MKVSESKPRYAVEAASPLRVIPDRVTVRLKPELARKLEEARRVRKQSVTEVIELALSEHFERQLPRGKLTLLESLRKHGVIGAVDLGPDASANYKELVREAIDEKYGDR